MPLNISNVKRKSKYVKNDKHVSCRFNTWKSLWKVLLTSPNHAHVSKPK